MEWTAFELYDLTIVAELEEADGAVATLLEEVLPLQLRVLLRYLERFKEIVLSVVARVLWDTSLVYGRPDEQVGQAQRWPAKDEVFRLGLNIGKVEAERTVVQQR